MTGTHPRQRPRMDLTGAATAPCSTSYFSLLTSTFPVTLLFLQDLLVLSMCLNLHVGVKKHGTPDLFGRNP